jgi:type IV pilus assembly protein PilA
MVERIKNKKGFTIIEIMVVIALIGILAAVLVPKFSGIKDRARDAGMLTNAKMVEAYVASVIDEYSAAKDDDLVTAIQDKFDATDALTNPYTGVQEDDSINVAIGTTFSAGTDVGTIYVRVDGDDTNNTLEVFISGVNSNGERMENTERTVTR